MYININTYAVTRTQKTKLQGLIPKSNTLNLKPIHTWRIKFNEVCVHIYIYICMYVYTTTKTLNSEPQTQNKRP